MPYVRVPHPDPTAHVFRWDGPAPEPIRLNLRFNADPWQSPSSSASAEATERARALLLLHLNKPQRKSFEKHQFFLVKGSEGNVYRIDTGGSISGNIRWVKLDKDEENGFRYKGKYCAYPRSTGADGKRIPKLDQILGQMMHIVTDENDFLSTSYIQSGSFPKTFVRKARKQLAHMPEQGQIGNCQCDFCSMAFNLFGQAQ